MLIYDTMASSSTSSMSASPEALSQGTHQGEGGAESGEQRVFTCTVCFRNFNRLLHLQRHEYIHSDFKPFKCPWCPKVSRRIAHQLRQCPVLISARQSFTRQDSLVRHARLHCKKQEDTRNVSKALHKHKGTFDFANVRRGCVLTVVPTCSVHELYRPGPVSTMCWLQSSSRQEKASSDAAAFQCVPVSAFIIWLFPTAGIGPSAFHCGMEAMPITPTAPNCGAPLYVGTRYSSDPLCHIPSYQCVAFSRSPRRADI